MHLVASAGLVPASARSLPPFKLYRPRSIAQVMEVLGSAEDAALLAGGTDLVAAFNEGLRPRALVSLALVEELRALHSMGATLRLGATVTHGAGSSHAAVLAQAPGLAKAWARIANPRIRFSATLGGNLMARRPRYEASLLLTAARANLEFATVGGVVHCTPQSLWADGPPARSLLVAIEIHTADLVDYFYERSLRPLLTLAAGIRRVGDELLLSCAVATEYLQPALLELKVRRRELTNNNHEVARELFKQLPARFADPVLTHSYAKTAGAVLLARRLAGVAHA